MELVKQQHHLQFYLKCAEKLATDELQIINNTKFTEPKNYYDEHK